MQNIDDLKITLVQTDLVWENKQANLQRIETVLETANEIGDIILLPEMFSTGFSMNVHHLADEKDGSTLQWMHKISKQKNAVITGSIIVKENDKFYNRLFWVQPDGQQMEYNKRHLFSLSDEPKHYTAGTEKLFIDYKGWKIFPIICYDLRFPVWCRNDKINPYDVNIVVANWPEKRSLAWKTLLHARAIENQCYVVGINRVGHDGNNLYHSGNSAAISANGEYMFHAEHESIVKTISLNKEALLDIRKKLPFLYDMDNFKINT